MSAISVNAGGLSSTRRCDGARPSAPAITTSLPTRRHALATLAGVGAALSLPQAAHATAAADPIPALYAEMLRTVAAVETAPSEAERDLLMDRWAACDDAARACPATTAAGAAASLEWVRCELLQFGFEGEVTSKGPALILALLDGALGVLRSGGAS